NEWRQVLHAQSDGQETYLLVPGSSGRGSDQQDLQERGHRPADVEGARTGAERALISKCRAVRGKIKNQVVGSSVAGKVFPPVVDDVVGAERAHELQLLRVIHPSDLGP